MPAEFSPVPGGWFLMGSDSGQADEAPVHRVWVDPFAIGVCPVTRSEYARFLDATDHARPRGWDDPAFDDPTFPVVGVSWHDAVAYCAWRSADGVVVRLPTEAEWERAARGGLDGQPFPGGEHPPAWLPAGGHGPLTAPWAAALGEPNAFGLYGIGANVHEWCADWHAPDYYAQSPERNPKGPASGSRRASRGGAWRHAVTISRTAARSRLDPSFRYTDYGFRVVRSS
jgi:formylglycine-generating enzyme